MTLQIVTPGTPRRARFWHSGGEIMTTFNRVESFESAGEKIALWTRTAEAELRAGRFDAAKAIVEPLQALSSAFVAAQAWRRGQGCLSDLTQRTAR